MPSAKEDLTDFWSDLGQDLERNQAARLLFWPIEPIPTSSNRRDPACWTLQRFCSVSGRVYSWHWTSRCGRRPRFKALVGISTWSTATPWLQHKWFHSNTSLGDIFLKTCLLFLPVLTWQEKVSLKTLCSCWGLMFFCNTKSRYELPKVFFA